MLLLNLILLIDVTFSTPTPGHSNHGRSQELFSEHLYNEVCLKNNSVWEQLNV
jgi:hypothetical protein